MPGRGGAEGIAISAFASRASLPSWEKHIYKRHVRAGTRLPGKKAPLRLKIRVIFEFPLAKRENLVYNYTVSIYISRRICMKTMRKWLCATLCLVLLPVLGLAEGANKIIVGTNAEFPPFEYIADDGSFAGFDMDLISAIMKGIGVEYEIQTMDFDALLPSLASGKIHVSIAALTIQEDRQENAFFSDPYFHATQKIIVKADNGAILSEADLEGKKVGVQLGTTGDLYISDLADYDATVERYAKALDAVMDLSNGRLDAVIVDEGVSDYFAASIQGLKILDEVLSDEYYGIAMKLGEDAFMAKINEQLAKLVDDGTYDALYAKHFGAIETEE